MEFEIISKFSLQDRDMFETIKPHYSLANCDLYNGYFSGFLFLEEYQKCDELLFLNHAFKCSLKKYHVI